LHLIDADDRDTSASSITVRRRERNIIGRTVKDTRTACVTRRVQLCTTLSRISGCHRRAQRRRITGQSDAFVSRLLQASESRFPLRIISTNNLGTVGLNDGWQRRAWLLLSLNRLLRNISRYILLTKNYLLINIIAYINDQAFDYENTRYFARRVFSFTIHHV